MKVCTRMGEQEVEEKGEGEVVRHEQSEEEEMIQGFGKGRRDRGKETWRRSGRVEEKQGERKKRRGEEGIEKWKKEEEMEEVREKERRNGDRRG